MPVYGDILAKMIDFMCEELQHERFQEARPTIMIAATRVGNTPHLADEFELTNVYVI